MTELKDINALGKLIELMQVMAKVSRVSYVADKAKQRYPSIEMMTTEELESLTKMYLALGFDFEEAYLAWKKYYDDYTKESTAKK